MTHLKAEAPSLQRQHDASLPPELRNERCPFRVVIGGLRWLLDRKQPVPLIGFSLPPFPLLPFPDGAERKSRRTAHCSKDQGCN